MTEHRIFLDKYSCDLVSHGIKRRLNRDFEGQLTSEAIESSLQTLNLHLRTITFSHFLPENRVPACLRSTRFSHLTIQVASDRSTSEADISMEMTRGFSVLKSG